MHDEAYYRRRVPISDLGPWKNFFRFLWDKERHTIFDRTPKQWGQLGLFYLCFYGVLLTIFGLQMRIGFKDIPEDRPYLEQPTGKSVSSRIFHQIPKSHSGHPGLGFVPNIHAIESLAPVIWIDENNSRSRPRNYVNKISDFLASYNNNYDLQSLGKCSNSPYGYSEPYQPCVYVKFNKRFDWVPISYNSTSELPENMPETLKSSIRSSSQPHIWIHCSGLTSYDNQHVGSIDYLPHAGLPVKYFPFNGRPNYLSPFIALVFNNLSVSRLITIKCSPWAFNIDQKSPLYFQMLIE